MQKFHKNGIVTVIILSKFIYVELTMRKKIKSITSQDVGSSITIKGWVRSVRDQKKFAFIAVNDGSQLSNFQVVADQQDTKDFEIILPQITNGCSVSIVGSVVESPGKGQSVELKAQEITVLGGCDGDTYPLGKKRHTFEFLRTIAHLRPRTNTLGAVARVRNALAYATHKFFQEEGFLYIHTPIITQSDCEGAGEMFNVSTIDPKQPPKNDKGNIDYSQDFFGKRSYLTVSGQLSGETYACALSDIYTFGPTFRAENSNTSRHLAEFWMIEPEIAFADLSDDIDLAEKMLKHVFRTVLEHCEEDMNFFAQRIDKTCITRLDNMLNNQIERIEYRDAISIIENSGTMRKP